MKTERLGEVIRFHRKEMNLTAKEFINRLGGAVSPAFMTKLEKHGAVPSPELICRIADVINLPPEKLLDLAKAEKLNKYEKSLDDKYSDAFKNFKEKNNANTC